MSNDTRVVRHYRSDMSTNQFITTTQLALARGVTRQHVARLVREGKLTPVLTLASGAHLFTEDQAQVEGEES